MDKWRCIPCDFVYDPAEVDPDSGISPGTPFEDLPAYDNYSCIRMSTEQ